jgi:YgiT-type zinc finger domain-containing protein
MTCSICKTGKLSPGTTTVSLTRGATTVVIKDVPGLICDDCGEYWLDAQVTENVYKMAEEAVRNGTELELRRYSAA